MFEGYKKYWLVLYCDECGTDDGPDFDTKKAAESAARCKLREGWETVACINTDAKRIEFVLGQPGGILAWFTEEAATVLRATTKIPGWLYQ